MNSRALRTADRSAGPPRQTRTASGGVPSVAKASLATTLTPVERVWPTKAERVHGVGNDSQRWKPTGSARNVALRQDGADQPLPLHQFLTHGGKQRVGSAIGDPARC